MVYLSTENGRGLWFFSWPQLGFPAGPGGWAVTQDMFGSSSSCWQPSLWEANHTLPDVGSQALLTWGNEWLLTARQQGTPPAFSIIRSVVVFMNWLSSWALSFALEVTAAIFLWYFCCAEHCCLSHRTEEFAGQSAGSQMAVSPMFLLPKPNIPTLICLGGLNSLEVGWV